MAPVYASGEESATTESIRVVGVRSNAAPLLVLCGLVPVASVNNGTSGGALPPSPLSLCFVDVGFTDSSTKWIEETLAEEGDVRDQYVVTEESCTTVDNNDDSSCIVIKHDHNYAVTTVSVYPENSSNYNEDQKSVTNTLCQMGRKLPKMEQNERAGEQFELRRGPDVCDEQHCEENRQELEELSAEERCLTDRNKKLRDKLIHLLSIVSER